MGDGGGGQHAHLDDVDAGAGQTRHHGGLQELSGGAGVTAHDGQRTSVAVGAGEHTRRRDGQFQGEGGGQVATRETAYTICSEQPSHRRQPLSKATPVRRR